MNSRVSIIVCFFIFVSLFNSCKKDDPDPDYVGKWAYEESIISDDQTIRVKEVLALTKNDFTDTYQVYDETSKHFVDYITLGGSISVDGSIMDFTIEELGVSSIDLLTGNPTGVITMYESGSDGFEAIFSQISQPRNFSMDFTISGNVMSVRSDINGDGDYNDEDEVLRYTKE